MLVLLLVSSIMRRVLLAQCIYVSAAKTVFLLNISIYSLNQDTFKLKLENDWKECKAVPFD